MLVTGDIGGTKTSLALFTLDRGPKDAIAQKTYPSNEYPSLEVLVRKFLEETGSQPTFGTFGVPGPVVEGRSQVTNLPWVVEEEKLRNALNFKDVALLNDLEAISNSIPVLEDDDLHVINDKEPVEGGSKGVVAPGTGLGEGFLAWDGKAYTSCRSEGGHATFAPMDELQTELMRFLMKRFGHVSCEKQVVPLNRNGLPGSSKISTTERLSFFEVPEIIHASCAVKHCASLCPFWEVRQATWD